MKARARQILLVAAALGFAAPPARPAPVVDALPAKRYARLRQRIDALLKHRLNPDPLPVLLPNPFRVVNGSITEVRADEVGPDLSASKPPADLPPGSNQEALARCLARIRISGTVALKGQLQVVINDAPRKEGDFIVLDRNNAMTYLQVVRIRPGEITLRLNDATQTIRF